MVSCPSPGCGVAVKPGTVGLSSVVGKGLDAIAVAAPDSGVSRDTEAVAVEVGVCCRCASLSAPPASKPTVGVGSGKFARWSALAVP